MRVAAKFSKEKRASFSENMVNSFKGDGIGTETISSYYSAEEEKAGINRGMSFFTS